MKKTFTLLLFSAACISGRLAAQNYSPVAVSGFNVDAIAESSPASASTTGSLDGSDYVLYDVAYGTNFGTGTGLPNNGTISSGSSSYQLADYTQSNTLYIQNGFSDSLTVNTPATFAAVSLLGFSTEGSSTMNITLRFTDGSTEVHNGLSLSDWFNYGGVIYGFDRTGRLTDSPDYNTSNPSMYATNLNIQCANQGKLLQRIIIQNGSPSGNPRACIFAVSAAMTASYTPSSTNLTCFGAKNGTASITTSGGLTPLTYSWNSTPAQTSATATALAAGNYTGTVHDATGCSATFTFALTEPAEGTITVSASSSTLCSGTSATLTTSGANTYTWTGNASSTATAVVSPTADATYSVTGKTSGNCLVAGTVSVSVTPSPTVSFVATPNTFCSSSPSVALSATPAGGTFSGTGVSASGFDPGAAGVGTFTLSYAYTDGTTGCTGMAASTVTVTTCTGLESLNAVAYTLYPNPNNGVVTIKLAQPNGNMHVAIYDALGKCVLTQSLGATETVIHTENLQQGIYYYSILDGSTVIDRAKMIRQ